VDKDRFVASAEGNFGDAQIRYSHGETITEPAGAVYSLEKINQILKADKFSDSAIIQLGDNMPLIITLEDFYNDVLRFMVAPRIESEA
jgi:proliferating cell nuclear antigen